MNDHEYQRVFRAIKNSLKSKAKKRFLDDLNAEIAGNPDYFDIVAERPRSPRHVVVSFDRLNNTHFSYDYFDLVLLLLSRLQGGHTLFKPTHQNRVILWRNSRSNLLKMLLFVRRNFGHAHNLRFGRAMVVPYPRPVIGFNIAAGGPHRSP